MILGFKQQFKESILTGRKKHTIREDKHNRWEHGKQIHFATGVRTKNYKQFKSKKCVSVQDIEIIYNLNGEREMYNKGIWVLVDNIHINDFWLLELAYNDGFNSIEEFFKWFNKDFKGRIIHWTDMRYNK